MQLSNHLDDNIRHLKSIFPIPQSFDIITRDLFLGDTSAVSDIVDQLWETQCGDR